MPLAPNATFGAFEIVSLLGAGGMGEVYRARDTRLDRDVALKVLPVATLSDETARARLLREARMASKLNHPHVCTIHEVGEADGQVYIAMELVEGQPLSALLSRAALPVEQCLRYGLQVADALAHAHDHGVVHRDLKSANIVITPEGRAKVLDFGLAKPLHGDDLAVATTLSQLSLTAPGTVAGTLAYMAPEQLRGRPADTRSDVWALGVVLYEMAAGQRPFQGHTGFELSSAILDQAPLPLPPMVPAPLATVIERCLAKEPGQRFQRAGEVRAALETVQTGGVIPLRLPWTYALSRHRWLAVAFTTVVLLMAAAALNFDRLRTRLAGRVASVQSLAVLPLENLSGNSEQDYLADGVHEALITDLAKLSGLRRVIARSSVMRYRKTDEPLPQIARELGVDALVTGSVLRSGDRVQITAHLIRGATEEQLWADRYEREFRDVLSLENDIVAAITGAIRLQLTPQEQARLAHARPVNPDAYDACLQGRFHWYKLSLEELSTAERYFELALEKDPNYALAYVGLADVWMSRGDAGFLSSRDASLKAEAAALKAVELDDTLADAHVTLGNLKCLYDRDWSAADKEFRRAIQLNPNSANAHFMYSDFLITMRRLEEWKQEIHRTLELDPFNYFFQCFYGWHLMYEKRYDEAIAQLRKVLAAQPDFSSAHMGLWGAYYKKGMDGEALAEAKRFFAVLGDREVLEVLDRGNAAGGYRGAMKLAGEKLAARAERTHVSAVRIARVFAHAGEKDRALEWLEKAYERRETPLYHIGVGWDWDALRSDPRFQSLLRRMNLPQE